MILAVFTFSEAQTERRALDYYISKALQNSPLQLDKHNQTAMLDDEKQYLMNVFTHAQTLLSGNYLFVPIIEKNDGTNTFRWNAQSANDYYGYDLGVSNGSLQVGVTWAKPLLGKSVYEAAESQINIQQDILNNNIRLNSHDIERNVIDQYILCLLDKRQIEFSDSISLLLERQASFIFKLACAAQAKQSDIEIIRIEQNTNNETKASFIQSYHSHIMELNALCCIKDTSIVYLEEADINKKSDIGESQFMNKYKLDSAYAIKSQLVYETRYKPQLNLFTNFGIQTTHYDTMYKNLGLSAGISFSMLLSDGKLKRIKRRETDAELSSISIYKNNLNSQNVIRRNQCSAAIKDYDTRLRLLDIQIDEYNKLLYICQKEVRNGQISVFDYITTLKNIISSRKQKMAVEANRQLAINAYNYYNW